MTAYTYGGYKHEHGENKYKITESGTAYHLDTPDKLVEMLENLRVSKKRIVVYYGKDGEEWGDKVACRLERSTGTFKVPLCIKQARSTGGEPLLDDCIARITSAGKVIYKA